MQPAQVVHYSKDVYFASFDLIEPAQDIMHLVVDLALL